MNLWKDEYEIGVPLIDRQHKELFVHVGDFLSMLNGEGPWDGKITKVNETLAFMKHYVVDHFESEEDLQKRIGYPEYEVHVKEHADMVAYIGSFEKRYLKNHFEESLIQEFAGKLLAWLVNHVVSEDHRIAEFLEKRDEYPQGCREDDPLICAIQKVMKTMLNADVQSTALSDPETHQEKHINIELQIIGDLSARVIYQYPIPTALKIVNSISGLMQEQVDPFVISALSEISNIISGSTVSNLAGLKYTCDITPPKMISGTLKPDSSLTYYTLETEMGPVRAASSLSVHPQTVASALYSEISAR